MNDQQTIDDGRETIGLLQAEIARLESELAERDEALRAAESFGMEGPSLPPEPDQHLSPTVARLTAEVADRDGAIEALLEEARFFEEAAEAQRAEWEQLSRWVEEVERRVEGRDLNDGRLGEDLELERRKSEDLSRRLSDDRRAWEAEKSALARESHDLRQRLMAAREGGGGASGSELEALERENQALRKTVDELGKAAALAGEVDPLRARLAEALADLEEAAGALRHERDEREREANESEAAIRTLHAKFARFAAGPPTEVAADSPYREAEERIRAFRQHLRELHDRETAERSSKGLGARLSRLWRHTSPA